MILLALINFKIYLSTFLAYYAVQLAHTRALDAPSLPHSPQHARKHASAGASQYHASCADSIHPHPHTGARLGGWAQWPAGQVYPHLHLLGLGSTLSGLFWAYRASHSDPGYAERPSARPPTRKLRRSHSRDRQWLTRVLQLYQSPPVRQAIPAGVRASARASELGLGALRSFACVSEHGCAA